MIERIVSSLAILKVNTDRGQTYFDSYVPFVAECIRLSPNEPVSLPAIQEEVAREFGLRIPQGVLKTILARVHRTGYLLKSNGVYVRNPEALPGQELLPARNHALRQYEAIVQRLIDFCAANYQVVWSQEEAGAALLSFLDGQSLGILRTSVDGRRLVPQPAPPEHTDFLVGAFITQTEQRDPEGFAFLETIVKGRMLADMLILPGVSSGNASFGRVAVYLDTNFVLRVIGAAPEPLQTSSREVVDLLQSQKASLRIFDHTYGEIENILTMVRDRLVNIRRSGNGTGETLDYFVQINARPSDIDLMIGRLPNLLASHRIAVVACPTYELHLGVDETRFQQVLQEEIGYKYQNTLQRDIRSLTAIHRLREGRLYTQIEESRAIFVTTNDRLAGSSARFFSQESGNGTLQIPHCVSDQTMAAIAWLKAPARAPDLPRQLLIANCYAALKPTDSLWQRYLEEIERLIAQGTLAEDDYYVLRYTSTARQALMDATLGESAVFTEGTVKEVLARAQAELRRESEEKAQAAENTLAQVTSTVSQSSLVHRQRIQALSARGGRIVARASGVLLVGVLVVVSLVTAPWPFQEEPSAAWRWVVCITAIALASLSQWSLYKGTTLAPGIDNIERWATRRCEAALLRVTRWLKIELPELPNLPPAPQTDRAAKHGD